MYVCNDILCARSLYLKRAKFAYTGARRAHISLLFFSPCLQSSYDTLWCIVRHHLEDLALRWQSAFTIHVQLPFYLWQKFEYIADHNWIINFDSDPPSPGQRHAMISLCNSTVAFEDFQCVTNIAFGIYITNVIKCSSKQLTEEV